MIDPITLSLAVWYPAMFLLKPDVVNSAENIAKKERDNLLQIGRNLLSLIEQKEQSLATLIKQLQRLPEGNCHSWGVLQVQEPVNNYHEVADSFNSLKELINSQKTIISHYDKVAEKIGVTIVGDNAKVNIENLIAGTQGCSLLELSQLLEKMNITNESLLSKIHEFNISFVKSSEEEVSDNLTPEQINKSEAKSNSYDDSGSYRGTNLFDLNLDDLPLYNGSGLSGFTTMLDSDDLKEIKKMEQIRIQQQQREQSRIQQPPSIIWEHNFLDDDDREQTR
jgi:hypothetical protein